MLNLSLPLLGSVLVLGSLGNSQLLFLIAALIGSGIGIYGLLLFLRHPYLVCFTNLMAVSLLLGYALGAVIFVAGELLVESALDMTGGLGLGYSQQDLSLTLLLVYITCSVLFFLSSLEKPIFEIEPAANSFALPRARLLIWIGVCVVIAAFVTGDLGYMGAQNIDLANVSVFGATAELCVPLLLPMSALCILDETSRSRRLLLFFALGLFLLSLLPLGRRVLIYTLLISLIALTVSRRKLPNFSLMKWIAFGLGAIGVLLFVYIGFYFFYALRLSAENLGHETPFDMLLSSTFEVLKYELAGVSDELTRNAIERTYILSYLAAFVGAQSDYSPLWGGELLYAIKLAIPSVVYPGKLNLLPSSPEEFVHPAFGFPIFDGPNTIVTAGLNDFGLIGILLYPLLLVAVYIAIRRLAYGRLPTFIYYFVMLRLIYMILYVEQSLAGMLTSSLRDLALITALYYFVWNLPTFRESSSISRVR